MCLGQWGWVVRSICRGRIPDSGEEANWGVRPKSAKGKVPSTTKGEENVPTYCFPVVNFGEGSNEYHSFLSFFPFAKESDNF